MLRKYFFLLVVLCFYSCDYLSLKKDVPQEELDTVINFTSIDSPPSFKECDHIIDKEEKSICFRNSIHEKIAANLGERKFKVKHNVNEVVEVTILVDNTGEITLKKITVSQSILDEIPSFEKDLQTAIESLPTVLPAIKRSIPVSTEYVLPIRITLEN